MALSTLDAYSLLRFAEDFRQKLFQAEGFLAERRGLAEEKTWLRSALDRLENACTQVPAALENAHQLPELASVRDEYAWQFQGVYVDALEKLVAGITFHVSARAPIMEALLPQMKLAALRRATREQVEKYQRELEKRAKGSYVTRMLTQSEYAFLPPVLEQVQAAYARWQSTFGEADQNPEALQALSQQLVALAEGVELALTQSRLLAEAALAPISGAFEEQGLNAKPRKRSSKPVATSEEPVAAESAALPDEEIPADEVLAEELPTAEVDEPTPVKKRRSKPTAQA